MLDIILALVGFALIGFAIYWVARAVAAEKDLADARQDIERWKATAEERYTLASMEEVQRQRKELLDLAAMRKDLRVQDLGHVHDTLNQLAEWVHNRRLTVQSDGSKFYGRTGDEPAPRWDVSPPTNV